MPPSPQASSGASVVRSPGPTKYILCNCEEADPGAYNDKGILESVPPHAPGGLGHRRLRHRRHQPASSSYATATMAPSRGPSRPSSMPTSWAFWATDILGSDFSFDIAGLPPSGESYVAGEESAMMESGSRASDPCHASALPFTPSSACGASPCNSQ